MARLLRTTDSYAIAGAQERAQCTSHYLSPTSLSVASFVALATPLLADRWGDQRQLHTDETLYLGTRVDEIDVSNGHVISGEDISPPVANDGTKTDDSLPPEVSAVLTLRSQFSGGSFRGRMYLPAFDAERLGANGEIDATGLAISVDTYATWFGDIIAGVGDWVPVIYSRTLAAATPIIRVEMGNVFDVQRRRRRSLMEQRYGVTFA